MADTTGTREFGVSWIGNVVVRAYEMDVPKQLVFADHDWTVNQRSSVFTALEDCEVEAMSDEEIARVKALNKFTDTGDLTWLKVTIGGAPFGSPSSHHSYQPSFNYYIVGRHKVKKNLSRSVELLLVTRPKTNA